MAYRHRDSNSSTNSICPKPTLSPHPRQWLKPSRRQAAEHRHSHRPLSATKIHTASTSTGNLTYMTGITLTNRSTSQTLTNSNLPSLIELPAPLPDRDVMITQPLESPWSFIPAQKLLSSISRSSSGPQLTDPGASSFLISQLRNTEAWIPSPPSTALPPSWMTPSMPHDPITYHDMSPHTMPRPIPPSREHVLTHSISPHPLHAPIHNVNSLWERVPSMDGPHTYHDMSLHTHAPPWEHVPLRSISSQWELSMRTCSLSMTPFHTITCHHTHVWPRPIREHVPTHSTTSSGCEGTLSTVWDRVLYIPWRHTAPCHDVAWPCHSHRVPEDCSPNAMAAERARWERGNVIERIEKTANSIIL